MIAAYTDHRNSKLVSGTCRYCKRTASLRTFDGKSGGHWFHVWEQCSLCGEHDRLALEAYEVDLEQTVADDRARAAGGERAAAVRVVKHLVEEARWDAARAALDAMMATSPERAELETLLETRSFTENTSGWSVLDRAWRLTPEDTPLLERLATALVAAGEHGRAAEVYRELEKREPARLEHPLALARALAKVGQYEESVAAFDRLFAVAPDRKRAGWIVRERKEAHEAIGCTPEEIEARRRERSRRSTRQFSVFAGLCVLAAVCVAAVLNQRVRIVVDNPTRRPFTLKLDGEPWLVLDAGHHEQVWVWRGPHRIDVEAGARRETVDVTWAPPGLESLNGGAYVFDPFRCGAYELYEVGYGPSPRALRTAERHLCERSFYAGSLDVLLGPPPAVVPLQSGESKVELVLGRLEKKWPPAATARQLVADGRVADAVRYLENAVENRPDDERLLDSLVSVGSVTSASEVGASPSAAALAPPGAAELAAPRAAELARPGAAEFETWLASECTDEADSIPFHRLRQDRLLAAGDARALEQAYGHLPATALGAYLSGRVASSPAEALADFDRSIALDGALAWPLLDSGELLVEQGEIAAGVARLRQFQERRRSRTIGARALWRALATARQWPLVEQELRVPAADPERADAHEARGRLLVATKAAESDWGPWARENKSRHPHDVWFHELVIDRGRLDPRRRNASELDALESSLTELARCGGEREVVTDAFGLGMGARAGAAQGLESLWAGPTVTHRAARLALLLGIAEDWVGEDGSRWFERVEASRAPKADREVASFLLGKLPLAALVAGDWRRAPDQRSLSLVAQALRTPTDPTRRAQLLDEADRFGAWDLTDAAILARTLFAHATRAPLTPRKR